MAEGAVSGAKTVLITGGSRGIGAAAARRFAAAGYRVAVNYCRSEAQARALAGMGEGESLSRALAQAHGGLMAYQLSALLLGMALVLVGLEGIIMLWRWILPLAFQGGPL